MRFKFSFSIALVALTLAGSVALANPPKKKPNYPPPEQSSSVGVLGQHHTDPNGPAQPREPAPPVAAPAVPKVEAEPPAPLTAPERFDVRPESDSSGAPAGQAPMAAVPMGPPPSGFLPDHPFISGIVAGLVGTTVGSVLYGGPMMGDNDGVMIGYVLRVAAILGLAWLVFRLIAQRASGADEAPRGGTRGRREPSFGRGADAGGGRREPTFGTHDRTVRK